jgi:hypothetical protein
MVRVLIKFADITETIGKAPGRSSFEARKSAGTSG